MGRQIRFLGILLLFSLVCATWLFWHYERNVNPAISSFSDVLWWWVVSSTTVGYGDIVPITSQGRIAGVITIIVGIYCYTNFIAFTADTLYELMNRHRLGTKKINFRDHIVICEYTAFADELLQVLDRYPELAKREVVIVSDLVQVNPYPQHHFVRGVPISPTTLRQANIQEAAFVFVFSNVRFQEPDLKTLHTVSRIQKLNEKATIFVEMNQPESELTRYLDGPIIILKSKELLESVMQNQSLDLSNLLFPRSDLNE
jgi:voltage-gated potassium channel